MEAWFVFIAVMLALLAYNFVMIVILKRRIRRYKAIVEAEPKRFPPRRTP